MWGGEGRGNRKRKRWADLFLFSRYVDLLIRRRRLRRWFHSGRLGQSKRELAVQRVVRVYEGSEVFKCSSIVTGAGAVTVTAVGGAVRLYEAGLTLDLPGQQNDDEGKAAA